MEIAKSDEINVRPTFYQELDNGGHVWQAQEADLEQVERLVDSATWRHRHVDWFAVRHWLGQADFVVSRSAEGAMGCLAIAADPAPGAWLRLAALERKGFSSKKSFAQLASMMDVVTDALAAQGITEIGWMAPIAWPDQWAEKLGFTESEKIITYQKPTFKVPLLPSIAGLEIRPGQKKDAAVLAEIEERTYTPLWRHSSQGIEAAMGQAFSFDVAALDGKIVGFQHSATNRGSSVHLARISVDPACHGLGIGSQLLAHAVKTYQTYGMINMTLNTESANIGAQRLYQRFGYKPNGHRFPMYTMRLG